MKRLLLLTLAIFMISCGNDMKSDSAMEQFDDNKGETSHEIPEEHVDYISSYGWRIKKWNDQSVEIIDYLPELMAQLRRNGVDLYEYEGKKVKKTTYTLEEEQENGREIFAVIYEIDGKIIGSEGIMEGRVPGGFPLKEGAVK
ncbi:DUF4830 domain-containing protein [Halobacillus sp. K22]|uniref:DUF4830 domain-containing protein n=1 Tax=Halobacillus sp. K22 TaxID=3457431 RepID=UPI003FCC8E69